jgi:6-phosphogluconolactonase (cycloisomerase 2 family)
MNTKAKWSKFLATILTAVGVLLLGSCGYHYKCGVTFGASSCTPSGGGIGTTGGTNGSVAFAFNIVDSGSINGVSLTSTSVALQNITGFTSPSVPSGDPIPEIVVAQKKFVYAAFPFTQALYAFSLDTTGTLTVVSGSPYTIASLGNVVVPNILVNMSSITVNPSGTLLFIAAASLGAVDVYQIGSTGTLTQVPGAPFSTGVVQPWNLWFDGLGKYLYVTDGPEGASQRVGAFAIGSTGTLTAVPGNPFLLGMWEMQGDPSGNFMIGITGKSNSLNGSPNDNSLYVFAIQQSGPNAGALTQVSGSPFVTVSAPINLAVQPIASNGNFVYSFSGNFNLPGAIEGYQLDTTSGTLTPLSTSPFIHLGSAPWGQFDQSGTYLFIFANTSTNTSMAVLNAAAGTGTLTEPGGPFPLATSTYFTVTDVP